ncbi:MAG: hypothetical protein NXI24_06855 [bacterium]|nr:hypothetical protein [bacterium]
MFMNPLRQYHPAVPAPASFASRLLLCLALPAFVSCADYGGQQGFLGLLAGVGGVGSSPVESITQVPTTVITASPATVAVAAVDLSRSFVLCSQTAGSSRPNNFVTCQLSAADQVTIETFDPNNQRIALSIVQFASGAFVQRGSTTLGAGDSQVDIALSAVNLSQTFAIVTNRINTTNTTLDSHREVAPLLVDASTLRLARGATGTAVIIEWQVIELGAASVQSGTAAIVDGSTSTTAAVAPFDPAKSFVLQHTTADASVLGKENSLYVRNVPDAGSSVQFFRSHSTGTVSVHYFLVSMLDLSTVQRGTHAFDAAYTNTPVLTAGLTAVDTNRAIALASADIQQPGNLGSTSDQDSGKIRTALQSGTLIEVERGSAESPRTGTINWQVVEFSN